MEKRRDAREQLRALKKHGPQWEAVEDGEGGYFTSAAAS